MKKISKNIFVIGIIILFNFCLHSVGFCTQKNTCLNENLRKELLNMCKEDQEIRQQLINVGVDKLALYPGLIAKLKEIDSKNLKKIKEIIKKFGWPGISLVGIDGENAAFLLVQHADTDIKFQKECLLLIKKAAEKGEAGNQTLPYLTDRVLVKEGKKQIYGTQAKIIKGELIFDPIEDMANVNTRRKEVGLPPLEEYKKLIEKMYKSNK